MSICTVAMSFPRNTLCMKKSLAICLVALCQTFSVLGQVTYKLDGFSNQYYGKAYISDTSEIFSAGWVAVYDRKTGQELIHVDADELTFTLHDGALRANVAEIPYGEYSVLLYEDYNFDGKKDFALMDGQHSCYHGPSFQIYLASDDGFIPSAGFTALAQDNCGMFVVNTEDSTVSTMVKDGCCWHQFRNYVIRDNEPELVLTYTDDARESPITTITIEEWDGTKKVESVSRTIDLEDESVKQVFRFHVDRTDKSIILYNINNRELYYAATDSADNVELLYPAEAVYQSPDFTYDRQHNILRFRNKDASYAIYDKTDSPGIDITVKGKTYHWKGNRKSRQGSLGQLMQTKFDNVVAH